MVTSLCDTGAMPETDHRPDPERSPDPLHELEQTLVSRRELRPAGSCSAKLFADQELLMRKVMEEAFEVCPELGRAEVNADAVAAEAADLVYHLMAGLASVDVSLDAPTVLPLAGRDDLVAVHLVVSAQAFWIHLAKLRELGASGIVALPPDALLP
jgi:phosphoribosyl-ATP pyrophosphohydrolase